MENKPSWTPIIITFLIFLIIRNMILTTQNYQKVSYDEFTRMLKDKEITEVIVTENTLKGFTDQTMSNKKVFVTNLVDSKLAETLSQYDIKYTKIIEDTFFRDLLSWIIPPLFFVLVWIWFMKKMTSKGGMGGSLMSVGKSKAKVYVEKDTGVDFDDVAGVDEAKAELEEVINFLKDSEKYSRLGGRMPKGVLLVGPPGTGKTLLAKAVAGEARVPFFSISGSEFVELFVGVGAARVRDLFEQARKTSPCIIFIDELDALGKVRGASGLQGSNDEKEQTLNQLLTEMDGFDSREGIILIAATNRPEILDPALLRAGRFDRQVLVDRPDKKGRIDILKVHANKVKLDEKINLEQIAGLTTGFTGADLANLVNEAALVATRRDANQITNNDFTQAIERIVAGLEKKNRILNDFERNVTAHHEMGHAIIGMILKSSDEVHKVSIIPRGIGALGYTIQRPTEDRFLMKREELENKICVLLGGRVAEKVIFNHLSTGASDDIAKATDIARSMVLRYGMCETLGHVSYEQEGSTFLTNQGIKTHDYSEQTAHEIDLAVKAIIQQCFNKSKEIINIHLSTLKKAATLLLEKETLEGNDLKNILKELKEKVS